jgi:hypothetical protein
MKNKVAKKVALPEARPELARLRWLQQLCRQCTPFCPYLNTQTVLVMTTILSPLLYLARYQW